MYSNDKRNGLGVLYFKNGDIYEGPWKDDVKTGSGATFKYSNGDAYFGEFASNRCDGMGKMTYASGDMYEGEFKEVSNLISFVKL